MWALALLCDEYNGTGIVYPTGIAATADGPMQTWSVASQAPVRNIELQQSQKGCKRWLCTSAPVQNDAVRNEVQAIGMSVSERLRRLARHHVNNPESFVNGVHLEPDPSSRFQVVITIKMTDILEDAIS